MNLRALAADPTQIPAAIARAASASGIDFSYLLHQAQAESGLNPTAHARTSSAAGLFQFIDSTWMAVIKQHGAANGLGWAADAMHWVGGKLRIADPAARAAVLALRQDPQACASMAAAYAADNKAGLEARLGRAVGAADLALAHFLGLGGATKFLRALAADPGATAASAAAPHVAHANHAVFFRTRWRGADAGAGLRADRGAFRRGCRAAACRGSAGAVCRCWTCAGLCTCGVSDAGGAGRLNASVTTFRVKSVAR